MEAAVTFVGFAASLVTLIAVVGDSAQTVHTLWNNFRESPTNLNRLSHAIAENEALLKDMQAVSDAYERVGIPESLLSRWKSTSSRIQDDFKELNKEMSKILECTKGSEITRKHLRRRVRHFFSEKTLDIRCQQLSTHKADMSYIHLLMHSSYTIQIGEEVHSFGQMIETLRHDNLSKLDGLQDSLETTRTELVQAVQSELGRFKNSGAIDRNRGHHRSSAVVHAVEWHSHKYRFAIGALLVEHVESVDVDIDEGEDAPVQLVSSRSKKIRFIFEPPPWFSSLIMKIDITMQISRHGCTPSIKWGPVPSGKHLEPLVDELNQISNLTLDRRLLAIVRIGELDHLFEDVVSYCLGIVSSSGGMLSQRQRDARPIADALEQGRIPLPGGEEGSRFLTKIVNRIEGIKNNIGPDGEQSRSDLRQSLSKASVIEHDDILLDRVCGYLSETQRAIMLSSNLIDAGAQLPVSIDFASILMTNYGLWYLQSICPAFDITEIGNLSLPSQWIFACLVRTVAACYESVSRQLQGFPVNALQFYISAERLTHEINSSHESLRHRFLLSLSVGGSTSMLEALLFHGLSMGDLSTYYLQKATERGRMDVAYLLLNYGASLSLETSTRLLKYVRRDLKTLLRDPRKSEVFYHVLARTLALVGPLQELHGEHTIFESLVRIFGDALLQSTMQHINYSTSSSDDNVCNKVVRLLLEAGLYRDSKLPASYWSIHLIQDVDYKDESPLTLAIYVHNLFAIRLLLKNGYDVNELCIGGASQCMENKGTPLTYAIWLGFTEAVTILLEAGADVTKIGAQGQTAPEMAKKCVSLPIAKRSTGCAKLTGLEDRENDAGSRYQILTMVCANLKMKHGMEYEDIINKVRRGSCRGSAYRHADFYPPLPRYWSNAKVESCAHCPWTLASGCLFAWEGYRRYTFLCPCSNCQYWTRWTSESSHSPLPESWERIVAPCKCSFVEDPRCGSEESFVSFDGARTQLPCPSEKGQKCRLRVLYINHITGETTLHCPCATCFPNQDGLPCTTISSLFGGDEDDLQEEHSDPLIPAQDLTRAGNPCWRLGDLFNEDRAESLGLEDDPVIPAQDVGLHIFDDIPGFALARNHLAPITVHGPHPVATSAPESEPLIARPSDSGLLASLTTEVSKKSFLSLFVSHTVTRSTRSADDRRLLSLHEVIEAFFGLAVSVLLVIMYECVSIYTYIKTLPPPPPFLSKLVLVVLLAVGLRILKGNFGLM